MPLVSFEKLVNINRRQFLKSSAAFLGVPAMGLQNVSDPSPRGPGRIRTVVGTGVAGMVADGNSAETATINNVYGVMIGPDGGLYWCDLGSSRILRMDLNTRRISVVAGRGTEGYSGDGGPATSAELSTPHEVRFDRAGDLYFCERDNHTVRKVDMQSGIIQTVAGTGERGYGGDGGPAIRARLAQPHSIAFDRSEGLYVCDIANNRVRRIDPNTGIIRTFAGTGDVGPPPDSGRLAEAALTGPRSIDIAPDGTMYLILREGNAVYEIDSAAQTFRRLAGTGELRYSGDGGPAIAATFGRAGNPLNGPKGIAYGGDDSLYIVDTENHAIRKIALDTGIITTVAGNGERGDGPDGDPLNCRLSRPHGVFAAGSSVYIGDSENHRIRVLDWRSGSSDALG